MKTIDAKGKQCPLPLIMTKKALNEIADNETLVVLIDNETSAKNVKRFLEENNFKVNFEELGNEFKIIVNKTSEIPESSHVEEFCEIEVPKNQNYVIAFQKNQLGEGSEELGEILIKGFINTVPEIENKPNTLIFLNSGIFLALKDSPVIESLKKLENLGIDIHVCGTCLDYFKKKNEIVVGKVSNMYDILDSLSKASKVIYS
jgi:selenium metabolism protein YedF